MIFSFSFFALGIATGSWALIDKFLCFLSRYLIIKIEEDSLISSVSGLKESPKNKTLLILLALMIFKISADKFSLILLLVFITLSTILNLILLILYR